jgi:hypothetical protein
VSFTLEGGHTRAPEQRWSEAFTCVGLCPAGVLEDLTSAIRIDPTTGRRRYDTMSCMAFVRAVLVPEDTERFDVLLHDPDRVVGLIELVNLVAWLSDELTLRPTPRSSASTAGGARPDGEATPAGAAT